MIIDEALEEERGDCMIYAEYLKQLAFELAMCHYGKSNDWKEIIVSFMTKLQSVRL